MSGTFSAASPSKRFDVNANEGKAVLPQIRATSTAGAHPARDLTSTWLEEGCGEATEEHTFGPEGHGPARHEATAAARRAIAQSPPQRRAVAADHDSRSAAVPGNSHLAAQRASKRQSVPENKYSAARRMPKQQSVPGNSHLAARRTPKRQSVPGRRDSELA